MPRTIASCAAAALSAAAAAAPASAACNAYILPEAFSLKQSNGFAITVNIMKKSDGTLAGNAHYGYSPQTTGTIHKGSFDGRVLKFRVRWPGVTGRYEGAVDSNGTLSGSTKGGGSVATFKGLQKFKCAD